MYKRCDAATFNQANQKINNTCVLHASAHVFSHNLCLAAGIVTSDYVVDGVFNAENPDCTGLCNNNDHNYNENICMACQIRKYISELVLISYQNIIQEGANEYEVLGTISLNLKNRLQTNLKDNDGYDDTFAEIQKGLISNNITINKMKMIVLSVIPTVREHIQVKRYNAMWNRASEFLDKGNYATISDNGPVLDFIGRIKENEKGELSDPREMLDNEDSINDFMGKYISSMEYYDGVFGIQPFETGIEKLKTQLTSGVVEPQNRHLMTLKRIFFYSNIRYLHLSNSWGPELGFNGGDIIVPAEVFLQPQIQYLDLNFELSNHMPITVFDYNERGDEINVKINYENITGNKKERGEEEANNDDNDDDRTVFRIDPNNKNQKSLGGTHKRKTYKRKTYKRKSYKRKTYKRKTYKHKKR
jgi:hypothetical protein